VRKPESLSEAIGWLVLLLIVLGFVLWFVPFISFWAIRTLFNYHIEMSFINALAFWVLARTFNVGFRWGPARET
jgi:magnesium-transporting ATPase (P-type)